MKRRMRRGPWAGTLEILRFNWPSYMLTLALLVLCLAGIHAGGLLALVSALALFPSAYFLVASLLASHWIYDRSPLMEWEWLSGWLPGPLGRWVLIQAGFDSTHGLLREKMEMPPLAVVDLYGNLGVGGSSVRRARAENATDVLTTVSSLPPGDSVCDTILGIFSLHEIQKPEDRESFFKDMARALASGGQLVVVEHLRDWKNVLAFGPGFFHFHPEEEWLRCAQAAGFHLSKATSITPFVRAFVWRKP